MNDKELQEYANEISISLTPDQVDEALARFYPNVIGNGHPDTCLCHACAPGEYNYYNCGNCGEYVHYDEQHTCP